MTDAQHADEQAVERTVRAIYDAIEHVDAERLDAHFSRDSVFAFGRRRDSRHDDWATLSAEHVEEFQQLARIEITSAELRVRVLGDVAWVSDRIHQRVEAKAGQVFESDARQTLVLKREAEGADWLVVQFHASAGL